VPREPAGDQHHRRRHAASPADLLLHRGHLAGVAARVDHLDADDRPAAHRGGELHVGRRAESAVGHLHQGGLRVGHRAPGLVLLPSLLPGLQLRQAAQRRLDPPGMLAGGLAASIGGGRVAFGLGPQRLDSRLGLGLRLGQGRPPAE